MKIGNRNGAVERLALSRSNMDAPVEFQTLAETLEPKFRETFACHFNGLSKSQPSGLVMPPEFFRFADSLRNFQPRPDDTWIVTFPKCGTTWTQEMLWLIVNDCDFHGAQTPLKNRSAFLEHPLMMSPPKVRTDEEEAELIRTTLDAMDQMPPKRVIKSHLPLQLLHPKLLDTSKVVYVARNPKDVIVSFYHHHKLFKFYGFSAEIDVFADYFMRDLIHFSPFFGHVLEAWNQRHHPNLLFVFYEDLKRDLRGSIEKIAAFLGKPLTDEQLSRLTEYLVFDNFVNNTTATMDTMKELWKEGSRFLRKGKTGDWKNHFDAELNERIDRWIESNLAGSDLHFITELAEQD